MCNLILILIENGFMFIESRKMCANYGRMGRTRIEKMKRSCDKNHILMIQNDWFYKRRVSKGEEGIENVIGYDEEY